MVTIIKFIIKIISTDCTYLVDDMVASFLRMLGLDVTAKIKKYEDFSLPS